MKFLAKVCAKFSTAKIKLSYVIGLIAALAVGGISSAVVMASIPDSSGVIHGCYLLNGGTLRVIDSDAGATCRNGEVALSWNQTGPQGPVGPTGPQGPAGPTGPAGTSADPVAYGHVFVPSLSTTYEITPTRARNIITVYHPAPSDLNSSGDAICLKLAFTPHILLGDVSQIDTYYIRGENNDAYIDQVCGNGYGAIVIPNGNLFEFAAY